MSSIRNTYYQNMKTQNAVLKWHLNDLLDNLAYQSVLDIGGSIGFAKDLCINGEVKTVISVDPNGEFIKEFLDCSNDGRFKIIEDNIENVDFSKFKYEIAFLILNLPWLTDPAALIEKIASNAPNYIVIANHELRRDQQKFFSGDMSPLNDKIENIFKIYRSKELCITDLLASNGYYPLNVRKYNAFSAVLYTKDFPDRTLYDKAKYIIQVNSSCNFNCPTCYVDKLGLTLDEYTFHEILETVNENDIISLRGGEPTLIPNLISGFINPAIDKGAYVVVESNGSFIGQSQYDEYLNTFSNNKTEIRLSLDRPHLTFLSSTGRQLEHLNNIVRFIEDAKKFNVNFGLFSLGMDMKQISVLLEEFSLINFLKYIRPITKYLDIKDLQINGKFVDIYGNLHDRIAGIIYSEYDKGQSS